MAVHVTPAAQFAVNGVTDFEDSAGGTTQIIVAWHGFEALFRCNIFIIPSLNGLSSGHKS